MTNNLNPNKKNTPTFVLVVLIALALYGIIDMFIWVLKITEVCR